MWTSRSQNEPLSFNNGSSLVGDHIVVNATFPDGLNVTHSELKIWNGFTYETTRPLVIPTDPGGVFEGIIDPSQFDWIIISGIEVGLSVNITCDFTNSDSDFMAWPDSIDPSERTYANNLLNMVSGDKPEHDLIRWSETGSMHLACLDYSGEAGNWTLHLEVGARYASHSNGSSVSMDTYYLDRTNATYNILATGYSSSNETYQIMKEDVILCNFFSPHVTVSVPELLQTEVHTFNITWSCFDDNLDDVNYYSIWLSNNDGLSFMLLAQNLTRTWFAWDSDGWIDDTYIIRVRAYSIDITNPNNDVSDPPEGYWPGDYNDGFSVPIETYWYFGPPQPPRDILVRSVPDITIGVGITGYTIDWILYKGPRSCYWQPMPESVLCNIYKNGELFSEHHVVFWSDSATLSISLDNLTLGTYNFTLHYENPGVTGGFVKDVVIVNVVVVLSPFATYLFYLGLTLFILSAPAIALIILNRMTGKGYDRDVIKRLYNCSNIRLKSKLCILNSEVNGG